MPEFVTVFGATGAQGGSVVNALLEDGKFRVRAVTRNTRSEKALELARRGCEVFKADLDNEESIFKALKNAYGCFVITNYWEHMDKDKEVKQGKAIIDIAYKQQVQHFIYSGLESTSKTIGKAAAHMDAKGETEEYLAKKGVPYTSVRVPFYYENFLTLMIPQRQSDGSFAIALPMDGVPMDAISVNDLGTCIKNILHNPDHFLGKFIGLSGDRLTMKQYADTMAKRLAPRKFVAKSVSPSDYARLGFPGAEDLAVMFEFFQKGKPQRDRALTRQLNPNRLRFDNWVQLNRNQLIKLLDDQK